LIDAAITDFMPFAEPFRDARFAAAATPPPYAAAIADAKAFAADAIMPLARGTPPLPASEKREAEKRVEKVRRRARVSMASRRKIYAQQSSSVVCVRCRQRSSVVLLLLPTFRAVQAVRAQALRISAEWQPPLIISDRYR